MFIDEAEIYVKAGNGGHGAVSFRREKYRPKGGPDGGDGGRGGDIIIEVDNHAHALSDYNRSKRFLAQNGENGMGSNKAGKNGEDLILKVPAGTQIYEKGQLLADLTQEGTRIEFLKGGNGGWGNQHFASSIKQAPTWSKEGLRGESKKIFLELKTIADVGIIGLPNAGKSTFLSVVTSAKPKIADYPFTTLVPNLGTYIDKGSRIIFADIPGLIEGASEGRGLGDKFLKHIERTKLILHLIDANSDDVVRDYKIIRAELERFSAKLTTKSEIVALTKIEAVDPVDLAQKIKSLTKLKLKPFVISAVTGEFIPDLVNQIKLSLSK